MNIPEVPGSEEALKDLAPILPAIWDAIEAGTQGAREFFEDKGAPIDAFHGSSHVRWEARRRLIGQGHDIVSVDYMVETLAMNGLRLRFQDYVIWILKADGGGLPVPGPSPIRRAFYRQQLVQLVLPVSPFLDDAPQITDGIPTDEESRQVNVVFLWDVTSEYRFKGLQIVCPKDGGLTRASVQVHWGPIPVPHPALSVDAQSVAELVDDLDITHPEDEEGTGTGVSS